MIQLELLPMEKCDAKTNVLRDLDEILQGRALNETTCLLLKYESCPQAKLATSAMIQASSRDGADNGYYARERRATLDPQPGTLPPFM